MRSTILATEAIKYIAEVRRLARPADTFSLSINSVWPGAKAPTAEQTVVQLTLDASALLALRDLIEGALTDETQS